VNKNGLNNKMVTHTLSHLKSGKHTQRNLCLKFWH